MDAAFAVVLTVRVEVVPGLIEAGLSKQVGAGVPPPVTAHVRATAALKPPVALMLIVEVADPPGELTVPVAGAAETVKLPPVTLRVTVAGLLGAGVPVIVTVEVPTGVAALVEIVRVSFVDEPGVTGLEVNAQVAPDGRPEGQLRVTWLLNPGSAARVRAYEAEPPGVVLALVGLAVRV